jgi:hypothetical protein
MELPWNKYECRLYGGKIRQEALRRSVDLEPGRAQFQP